MSNDDIRCELCDRLLKPDKAVWLELETATDNWYEPGTLPQGRESQGCFPFGKDCARKLLKETAARMK